MRLLFLILLLLNLIYFGWHHYQLNGDMENFSASDPGLEKLVLLYEANLQTDTTVKSIQMPATEQANELAKGSGQQFTGDDSACYEIGPFNKKEDAQQLLELMKPNVKQVKLYDKSKMLTKFWVFLPSKESLQAARKIVNELASKGIKDYQILTILGKKNAISLGLYKERKLAELQVQHIKSIGYSPEIRVIERKVLQYWLGAVTDRADKARINAFPEEITEKIPCV